MFHERLHIYIYSISFILIPAPRSISNTCELTCHIDILRNTALTMNRIKGAGNWPSIFRRPWASWPESTGNGDILSLGCHLAGHTLSVPTTPCSGHLRTRMMLPSQTRTWEPCSKCSPDCILKCFDGCRIRFEGSLAHCSNSSYWTMWTT
jgi:hypothetical protein